MFRIDQRCDSLGVLMKILLTLILVAVVGAAAFFVLASREYDCPRWRKEIEKFAERPPPIADYVSDKPGFTQEQIDQWFEDYRDLEERRPEGCEVEDLHTSPDR